MLVQLRGPAEYFGCWEPGKRMCRRDSCWPHLNDRVFTDTISSKSPHPRWTFQIHLSGASNKPASKLNWEEAWRRTVVLSTLNWGRYRGEITIINEYMGYLRSTVKHATPSTEAAESHTQLLWSCSHTTNRPGSTSSGSECEQTYRGLIIVTINSEWLWPLQNDISHFTFLVKECTYMIAAWIKVLVCHY